VLGACTLSAATPSSPAAMPPKALTLQLAPGDFTDGQSSAVVSIKRSIAPDVIAFSLSVSDCVGQGILVGMLSLIVAGRTT
jgi:hypothetical protein